MLLPRRVRRRLLLPLGWVALGFLLLLGCLVVQQQKLRRWNTIQLTMPQLRVDEATFGTSLVYQSPTQLDSARLWHNAKFEGKELSDFFAAATTESAIQRIIADTSHAGGVRVRFLPGSTYANLIKYWTLCSIPGRRNTG